jgi:hypothetical protein
MVYVEVDRNVHMYVQDIGDGTPVVLVAIQVAGSHCVRNRRQYLPGITLNPLLIKAASA